MSDALQERANWSCADGEHRGISASRASGAGKRVFLCISIDVECDKGPAWKTRFPLQFKALTRDVPSLLMPLLREYAITPTFLLSPEVLNNYESVSVLQSIERCELGVHLHGEFIDPLAEPRATKTAKPQCAYPAAVELEKLFRLTELFSERFGKRPTAFRGGRFALSVSTLVFLEKLGYTVDSTVIPFRTNHFESGSSCDYWGAPLCCYRPSAKDPRRRGALGLVEVPVTHFAPGLIRWPALLLRLFGGDNTRGRCLRHTFQRKLVWIRPWRIGRADLVHWADWLVDNWPYGEPVVLNVMFHNVDFSVGASPYVQTSEEQQLFLGDLEHLVRHLSQKYHLCSVGLSRLAGFSTAG